MTGEPADDQLDGSIAQAIDLDGPMTAEELVVVRAMAATVLADLGTPIAASRPRERASLRGRPRARHRSERTLLCLAGMTRRMSLARLVQLMSAGVLTGNELGTLSVIHPAIQRLPFAEEVRAEQEITRRYGYVMPVAMTLAVASGVAAAGDGEQRALTRAGTACYATMLAITLIGNVPINTRTLRFAPDGDPEEWRTLRRRWDRLHAIRVVLDVAGLTCAAAGALRRR